MIQPYRKYQVWDIFILRYILGQAEWRYYDSYLYRDLAVVEARDLEYLRGIPAIVVAENVPISKLV